jgi:putative addiction module CopG family antidote
MPDIHLSDEDRAFIESRLEAGEYRTAEEVVKAGVQALREDEEELRRLIKVGEDDIVAGRFTTFEKAGDLKKQILALAKERRNARASIDPLPAGTDRPGEYL